MKRIKEKAEDVDLLFTLFRQQQTELGGVVTPDDKQALQDKLKVLETELNGYLAGEYGINTTSVSSGRGGAARLDGRYQAWLASHRPFHWFIAFYGILKNGGFDVVIGNPPYVEYSKVKNEYEIRGYQTEKCGNLFAFVTDRSLKLLNTNGGFGFIVPLSLVCTKRMGTLQSLLTQFSKPVWLSNFAERPGKLFVGAEVQLTILLSRMNKKNGSTIATKVWTIL